MNTRDLESYYSGYEDRDTEVKIPFEDYRSLEDKIEIYEKAIEEIEEVATQPEDFIYDFQCIKAILEDLKKELDQC